MFEAKDPTALLNLFFMLRWTRFRELRIRLALVDMWTEFSRIYELHCIDFSDWRALIFDPDSGVFLGRERPVNGDLDFGSLDRRLR